MEFDVKEVKETRKGKKYRAWGRESQKRVRKSPGPTALKLPPKVELTQWTQWTQWTQLTQLTQATQPTQATQWTRSTDKVLTSLNESSMRLSFCVKFFSHTYSCFPGAKSDKTSYVGLNWSIKQTASHSNNIDVVIVSTEGKWEKICALAVPSRRRRILFDRNPNLECRFHLNPPIRFLVSSCDPRGIMLRTFLREMNW